jgi:hypothetical protein
MGNCHKGKEHQVPKAISIIENWHARLQDAKAKIKKAQDRQKLFADQNRRDLTFKVGDKVMLSTRNIRLKRGMGTTKFLPQWVGPFAVTKVVNAVAYKLELPPSMRVHPVFHVSLLKPYRFDPQGRVQPPPPPLVLTDEDGDIFEVAAILDHREYKVRGGKPSTHPHRPAKPAKTSMRYLISWKGYGPEHNTWEPAKNLTGCQELLDAYWKARSTTRA